MEIPDLILFVRLLLKVYFAWCLTKQKKTIIGLCNDCEGMPVVMPLYSKIMSNKVDFKFNIL